MKKPCLLLLVAALFAALSAQLQSQTILWKSGASNQSTGTAPNTRKKVNLFGFPGTPAIASGQESSVPGVPAFYYVRYDNGWDGGADTKGWYITVVTQYFSTLRLSFMQASYNRSGTNYGPRDFKLQYSLDGSAWSDLYTPITLSDPWNSGQLVTNIILPAECEDKAAVQLRWIMTSNTATDGGAIRGTGASLLGNITVTGVPIPAAPTDINLSNDKISISRLPGTVVGNLSSADVNAGDTHIFTLVSGEGDSDNGLFSITGNQLKVEGPLTLGSKSIRIRDNDGTFNFEKVFGIDIQNYQPISGATNDYDWITNVTFNNININTVQESGGYGDYTAAATQVKPGAAYTLSVSNGAGLDPDYPQKIKAWFDWNGSGTFDDAGEEFTVASDIVSPGTFSISVPVPAAAIEGTTRMRVAISEDPNQLSTGPIDFGEAEDYSINVNSAYPVELSLFTASAAGKNSVVLSWRTATEVNNYGFEIERKQKDWEKIGFAAGHGNSNSPKDYTFTDDKPLSGKIEYRLKQIDNDGKFKYYDAVTVSVDAPAEYKLLQNSPNPFNPSTAIKFQLPVNSLVSVKVYDLTGREVATLVNEEKPAGCHVVYWNGRNNDGLTVASGVYLYKLNAGSYSQTRKMNFIK